MAHDTPQVNFEEGSLTINRHKANVLAQEQNFKTTVGEATIALAEGVVNDPAATKALISRTASGNYVEAFADRFENLVFSNVRWPPQSSWVITRRPSVAQEDFNPIQGYPVLLLPSDRVDYPLCAGGSSYGVDTMRLTSVVGDACRWYIKPRSPGEARFSFRFLTSWPHDDGDYIVDISTDGTRRLDKVDSLDLEDENHFFNVTLGEVKV
jgi:hypothetical protein